MNQMTAVRATNELHADAFIHGENTLTVISEQPFEHVAARLEGSIAANAMNVVQVLDFNQLLAGNGIRLSGRCRVYEVLEPRLAAQLVAADPALAHLLPLRIAIHEDEGVTTVTAPMPTAFMTEFSHVLSAARLAKSFEAGLHRVLSALR